MLFTDTFARQSQAFVSLFSFLKTHFQSPPGFAEIHCSCDKVNHIQEVRSLLCILDQIVT